MRRAILFPTVLAMLAIAACQSVPQPQEAKAAHSAPAQIHGRAIYLERMALPAQSALEVRMIADDANPPAIVAQASFGDLRGPPFDFSLAYDPAMLTSGGHYSLRAALRDAQGHLQFFTPQKVVVTPGSDRVVELRLVRAGTGAP